MQKSIETTKTVDIRPLTNVEIEYVTGGVRDGGGFLQSTTNATPKVL